MREKIIDATVEEFKQNGLKFTMNDLAKRPWNQQEDNLYSL